MLVSMLRKGIFEAVAVAVAARLEIYVTTIKTTCKQSTTCVVMTFGAECAVATSGVAKICREPRCEPAAGQARWVTVDLTWGPMPRAGTTQTSTDPGTTTSAQGELAWTAVLRA